MNFLIIFTRLGIVCVCVWPRKLVLKERERDRHVNLHRKEETEKNDIEASLVNLKIYLLNIFYDLGILGFSKIFKKYLQNFLERD